MNIRQLTRTICLMLTMLIGLNASAQNIELIPDAQKTITGNQTQQSFATAASLLYGMPFELSFDVTLTGTTDESGPSMNQWGSAILTTGTDPFNTPANGIQVYLHAKGNNGGQLLIAANGQKFFFSNVVYNTDNFNIHLIQSNGQLTMEVTNNATTTGTSSTKVQRYTKPMMFNQIDKLCYAMPTNMDISNLSLTVQPADMVNYITNIMPLAPGYLTEEAREYIVGLLKGTGDKLNIYKDFINASTNGANINGKRSYILPDPGKVYMMGNYIKNGNIKNYLTLWENKSASTVNLVIKGAFNPSDWLNPDGTHKIVDGDDLYMQNLFSYLWIPRTKNSEDVMTFYHATGLGYSLDYTAGVKQDNPTSWTMEHGLELGYLAMKNASVNKFVAANAAKTGFGAWGTGGMYASGKAQGNNWSTDFFFEEVSGFVPYDLNIIGLTNSDTYADGGATVDPATAKVQYQVQAGNYVDITNGGVILVGEGNESSLLSDLKSVDVTGKIAVITIGNGIITVEYTDFNTRKTKAEAELTAANTRLTSFAAGALYTSEAISAAQTAITAASELVTTNPKQACADLESAMETFYKTIDGRYVTMTNQTNNLLSTHSHTSLYVKEKNTTDEKPNYYGVYQLHYISGGAYQLRNAYYDNYVGQTTSASTVNSASNTVASRWRGTYSFELKKTYASPDAYNLVCTNGAANSLLGVSSTSIAKNSTDNPNDAANLWDIRLVDVKTYASAYIESVDPEAMDGIIGHAPSKAVATALQSGISTCPDRANNPTPEQETTLAGILNYYIDHKEDINKPNIHQYVTFQNRNNTNVYIGENLYEMKVVNTPDLGCVWETLIDEHNRFYFRNVKSGMYMGKVTQSAVGRLTAKDGGANKVEIDITVAPNRAQGDAYVVLQDKNTNNYRSYLHYSSDRNAILGWDNTGDASHWTISAVTDDALISYLSTATANVKTQLSTDITAYNNLGDTPGNYEKSSDVISTATAAANAAWPTTPTKEQALDAYNAAVTAFNDFTTAGTPMENNEMFLIKTSIAIPDQGSNTGKYIVSQVMLDNNTEAAADGHGSLTSGLQQPSNEGSDEDKNAFYLFTLWQAVKDGEFYKLYNFYTGYYLSKDVSMSNDAQGRFGLTTDPDEAASFIIKPQHGCFVTFHRSDYDEQNDGYLFMQTNKSGARTMFGLSSNNITTTGDAYHQGRMLFELEPATTEHYERCLKDMLDYPVGTGIGKYTDLFEKESKNYTTEKTIVQNIINNKQTYTEDEYKTALQEAARDFAPILAGLRINLPEAGKYYRIYNLDNSTRYYISKGETPGTSYMSMATLTEENAHNDVNSVFYYDGTYLLSYGNGYYIGGWAPWVQGNLVGNEHQKWAMTFANTGYTGKGKYSIKPYGRSYLYNNKTSGLNGWSAAFNPQCEWTLEEVTELPLKVTAAGYSTLFSARDHKIPENLYCYIATAKETDGVNVNIVMTKIEGGILPANTPVLVKAAAGTYLFSETDAVAQNENAEPVPYDGNLFAGQIETKYSGHETNGQGEHKFKEYTLQNKQGTGIGFYLYSGATLAGFKAYLPVINVLNATGGTQPSSVMFMFDDESTGISATEAFYGADNDVFYDLSGRRVTNPTSGIYIKNGKKYIIK